MRTVTAYLYLQGKKSLRPTQMGWASSFVPFATLSKGLGDGLDLLADGIHVGLSPRDLGFRRGLVNLDHHPGCWSGNNA